jgi:SAM-dependent methyltransferase
MSYVNDLEYAVGDAQSVLDVGCGNNSPIGRFARKPPRAVGVDAHEPWIDESRARGIHDEYRLSDVMRIGDLFTPASFDVVVACDLLEHLPADDGSRLLERMESLARERVVILTPNGWLRQEATWGNPYQVHRAGWSPADLRSRGYEVRGLHGLRLLRGERGTIRVRPRRVGEQVSRLTEPLVRRRPDLAFHLLAVKRLA